MMRAFLLALFFTLALHATNAQEFRLIEGNLKWNAKIDGIKREGHAIYELNASPIKAEWFWRGKDIYVHVCYSDGNEIYYVLKGSKPPSVERKTFIDEKGVPRIVIPAVVELGDGKVFVDFISDYRKFFGDADVSVSSLTIVFDGRGEFTNFRVLEWGKTKGIAKLMDKRVYIEVQIPQGNSGKEFLISDEWLPVEVTVRTMFNRSCNAILSVWLDSIEAREKTEVNLCVPSGYFERVLLFHLKPISDKGKIRVELKAVENYSIEREVAVINKSYVREKLKIFDVGVYPIRTMEHKTITVQKNLKNYVKVKEDFYSWFHRLFGEEESFDEPAGFVCCVIDNRCEYGIPLHVRFQVFSDGKEITFFRGEHLQREEFLGNTPVPETLIVAEPGITDIKMPIYADVYSVKPGRYIGVLSVSIFGSETIYEERFEFYVEKENSFKIFVSLLAIMLSILSVATLVVKQRKWIAGMKTNELIIVSLFTSVKFSIVDVPWFIFGDVVRAIFGPLGPFMHVFTGIFWDIINAVFLVALIVLVPKPGVVIVSSVIRIVLSGIVFGSFNPITIMLVLSYAAIAEFMLYLAGFTRGRDFDRSTAIAVIAVIFALKHIYSTYTFYYIWMFMYRLFYPDWYINLNAVVSALYSAIGAVMGVRLGIRLRRVVE